MSNHAKVCSTELKARNLLRISDYVYVLSGMIYDGANEEEIQKFLEQVTVESREKVLQEAQKSAEASRRNSRMDARKVDQGGSY
jgi:arsenate reductase-like glutaredoxin family protein